jgi:large subunit ribosomal protein L25
LIRHSLPIKAKPADIPANFVLDISNLAIGDVLHVSDLSVPAGVEVLLPHEFGLVTCSAPAAEKEEAAPAEGAVVEGAAPAEEGGEKKADAAAGGDAKKGDAKKGDAKKDAPKKDAK